MTDTRRIRKALTFGHAIVTLLFELNFGKDHYGTQDYVVRRRERSTTGHFVAATYTIYEKPIREALKPEKPVLDKPDEDEYMP